MGKSYKPRRGSLAFRPRKRAKKEIPRLGSWCKEEKGILGSAGYKVGMTHIIMVDDISSVTKGHEISVPVTIIETPPLIVYGVRAYIKDEYGKKTFTDACTTSEEIVKKLKLLANNGMEKIEANIDNIYDISVLAYIDAGRTGIGKKKAERMEIGVGGVDIKEKLKYCQSILGKEVKIGDIFKEGEYVDVVMVTKGKGWQGAVKRFGVSLQRRKATGRRRHVGTLGPWHPPKVMYTTPMAGQTGYHKRTEMNKRILKIGDKLEEIQHKGGFLHYGVIKNNYILLKGSVGGPRKRLIRINKSIRKRGIAKKPEIKYISI